MSIQAIVGANWGDEGKGKMTDYLAKDYDYVIRYQGGANAGHTVVNDYGKFALHQLPSGIFNENTINILGSAFALDLDEFLEELNHVGFTPNIYISDRINILLPVHKLIDSLEEERLSDKKFGSTKKGIAYFYSDKYAKRCLSILELSDIEYLKAKLKTILVHHQFMLQNFYNHKPINIEELAVKLHKQYLKVKPMIANTQKMISVAVKENKNILLEAQLGALRDPENGIYPYTSSSSPLAGFATVGAPIAPYALNEVLAITKAYSTCVGEGPFACEIFDENADKIREIGKEYGASTGRPRRIGWFDIVATKYGLSLQGATNIAITMLDVLSGFDKIPVVTNYLIDDIKVTDFPSNYELEKATCEYTYLDGWKEDISNITKYENLPTNTQKYIEYLENQLGVKAKYLSVGPKRSQTIIRD